MHELFIHERYDVPRKYVYEESFFAKKVNMEKEWHKLGGSIFFGKTDKLLLSNNEIHERFSWAIDFSLREKDEYDLNDYKIQRICLEKTNDFTIKYVMVSYSIFKNDTLIADLLYFNDCMYMYLEHITHFLYNVEDQFLLKEFMFYLKLFD